MIKYMYQFRKEGCYYGTMASKSCWRFNGFQFQYINSSVLCKRTLRKIRQNKFSCNCFGSNDYSYYNHKHNTYASNAYVLYRDSYTYDLYIHTQRWQAFKKILFTFIPYVSDILLSLVYLSLRTILMPNFDSAFGGQTLAGLSSIPNAVEPLLLFTVEMLILFLISKWIQHKKPKNKWPYYCIYTFNNNCSNIYTDVLTLHLLCKNKYIEICIGLNSLYGYFNFAYSSCYTLQYSYQ